MSLQEHDDDCKGCMPVLIDALTGKPLPESSLPMQAILCVWNQTSLEDKQAFHRVTCLNSRDPKDLKAVETLNMLFGVAMRHIDPKLMKEDIKENSQ